MFRRILIANRGEIACRIARTARRMGMATVAVHSDADRDALHVRMADAAVAIGPAPAADSYLRIDRIVQAARDSGAEAIHPGYGFLSENAAFAEAVAAAGLVFVGPPAEAIRAMGDKRGAKALMEQAGVPVVPGYHGGDQGADTLGGAAVRIGFPVLVKASAGGGGKGMRLVAGPEDFPEALAAAQRESMAAFGSREVLVERYLTRSRHVEVQVFADGHGNVVHLFERDCSIQRRHQKVLEEAPAPNLPADLRRRLGDAAVAAARAVGYRGAGTVEFILDVSAVDGKYPFYFMEMNTRLQVEHPVTEAITGHDLVEWQFRVAAGEPLPCRQEELAVRGHAIEVRLYAEDPARDFLPAAGRLERLRLPAAAAGVRVDAGVEEGDAVGVFYDPLIAKLIVHADDRATAAQRLADALGQVEAVGLATNLGFLARLAAHPAFVAADLDTGFIARHADALLDLAPEERRRLLALAAVAQILPDEEESGPDRWSPWRRAFGFRIGGPQSDEIVFLERGETLDVTVEHDGRGGFAVRSGADRISVAGARRRGSRIAASVDGREVEAFLFLGAGRTVVGRGGQSLALARRGLAAAGAAAEHAAGMVVAPMPGKVAALRVGVGDRVERGAPLLVLEAMKMEHTLTAPRAGVIVSVSCRAGELTDEGRVLVTIADPPAHSPGEAPVAPLRTSG